MFDKPTKSDFSVKKTAHQNVARIPFVQILRFAQDDTSRFAVILSEAKDLCIPAQKIGEGRRLHESRGAGNNSR